MLLNSSGTYAKALVLKARLAKAGIEFLLLVSERKSDMYDTSAATIAIPMAYLARIRYIKVTHQH